MAGSPLLREPEFRRFWSGQTISLVGDQVTLLALPLAAVLVLHASASAMGLLTAALLAPHLLLSLWAGVWLDRRSRRRRIMIAADLGRAALLATIPLAYGLGGLTMAQLYAVGFGHGCLSVFFDLAYSTVFVSVVPRDRILDANGWLMRSRAVSFMGGPSLAGLLVQILNAPLALLADSVSYLGSVFFLARVGAAEPRVAPEEPLPLRTRLALGGRFIASSPVYRASLGAVATINLFNFMFFALFVLYATRTLHVRPGTLGIVLAAGAVGSVVGSFVAGWLGGRIGVGRTFAVGCVLFPLPLLLVPLAGGPRSVVLALLFAAEFFSGLGVMILDISGNSINVAITPDRLRARVGGAYRFVNYGIRPVGALAGGFLGSAIGLRPTLWIASIGALAGVLWLLPSPVLALRELPTEAP